MKSLKTIITTMLSLAAIFLNLNSAFAGEYNNQKRKVKMVSDDQGYFSLYDCGSSEVESNRECSEILKGKNNLASNIQQALEAKAESTKSPMYYAVTTGAIITGAICLLGAGVCVWAPILTASEMIELGSVSFQGIAVLTALTAVTPTLLYFAIGYENQLQAIKDSINTIKINADQLGIKSIGSEIIFDLDSAALSVLKNLKSNEQPNIQHLTYK